MPVRRWTGNYMHAIAEWHSTKRTRHNTQACLFPVPVAGRIQELSSSRQRLGFESRERFRFAFEFEREHDNGDLTSLFSLWATQLQPHQTRAVFRKNDNAILVATLCLYSRPCGLLVLW